MGEITEEMGLVGVRQITQWSRVGGVYLRPQLFKNQQEVGVG